MNIFNRYSPFIQDFIYRNNWEALRAIQVAAGDAVFNTDDNILLSAAIQNPFSAYLFHTKD